MFVLLDRLKSWTMERKAVYSGGMINKNIQGVIWDLDHTLYPFGGAFMKAARPALMAAALELNPDIGTKDAADAVKNITRPFQAARYFTDNHQVDYDELFRKFYDHLDPGFLKPDPAFIQALKVAPQRQAVLTNATRVWAEKALDALGVKAFFDPIVTIDDVGGALKDSSQKPFDTVLQKMGLNAHETVFVEDTLRNLRIPQAMGITTVFIGTEQSVYADMNCDTPYEVLKRINGWPTKPVPGRSAPRP